MCSVVTKEIKRPPAGVIRSAMAVRNIFQSPLKLDRNNVALQERGKHERNRLKSLLRNAKQQYYREQFLNNRGNSGATWEIIYNILPNKKSISRARTNSEKQNNSMSFSLMLENAPLRKHKIILTTRTFSMTTHKGTKSTTISSEPNPSSSIRS